MKKIFTLLLLLATFSGSFARKITETEAMTVAQQFLTNDSQTRATPTLVSTKSVFSFEETQPFYIFNYNNHTGFVIVSGDDRARKILGYSHTGSIDSDNLPPQLSWLLSEYAAQISSLKPSSPTDPSWDEKSLTRAAVENTKVLKTSNWGQSWPYNRLCPVTNENKLTLTGCTATAMAIAMKYHNWPPKGTRTHQYHLEMPDLTADLKCDFENTQFQWDLMDDIVSEQSTEESQLAVATLMKSVAISLNSFFGCAATGAQAYHIVGSLREYFQYDYSCQTLAKSTFTNDEWEDIIVNQINKNHPIVYCGHSSQDITQGHTWVLDGYDKANALYHFNWGWDGYQNGFFSLEASVDSSGPSNVYTTDQKMIINIFPKSKEYDDYSRAYVEYPHHFADYDPKVRGGLLIDVEDIETGKPFNASINNILLPPKSRFEFQLAIVDENSRIKEVINRISGAMNSEDVWGVLPFKIQNCIVNTEISNNDYLQLIAIEVRDENDNKGEYKFVTGTIDAPTKIPVKGNLPNLINVSVKSDNNIILKLRDISSGSLEFKEYNDGDVIKAMPGSQLQFEITPLTENKDYGITYSVYDCFRRFNKVWLNESEPNKVSGSFECLNESTTFNISYDMLQTQSLELKDAGSLANKINEEKASIISSLKLSGKINAQDMWYINENFQNLSYLDLKETDIEESDNQSLPEYGDFIPNLQEKNKLPEYSFWSLRRLKEIVLPTSLEKIGSSSFRECNLTELILPENIKELSSWIANENRNLSTVYCLNPVPPVFIRTPAFNDTKCFENGILYVPIGSKTAYESAIVWKDFPKIVEVDFSKLDDVTININKTVLKLKKGETATLLATVLPETTPYKTVLWSSSNENVATVTVSGVVTGTGIGEANIVAKCGYVSASCKVIVEDSSDIEEVIQPDKPFSVYNLNGMCLKSSCLLETLRQFPAGVYILRFENGTTRKVVIR